MCRHYHKPHLLSYSSTVPPLEVRILGRREGPYSEGQQYKLVCESTGSRPSATITWWKDGMLMTDTRNQVSQVKGGSGRLKGMVMRGAEEVCGKWVKCRERESVWRGGVRAQRKKGRMLQRTPKWDEEKKGQVKGESGEWG